MLEYHYSLRSKYNFKIKIFIALALIIFAVLSVDNRIRPMIKTMAASQAKVFATRIINESINKQFSSDDLSYDALVKVILDGDGKVTSVQTDMVRLNVLKSKMTAAASEQLNLLQNQTVRIPLGTLLGLQIFSGRGPKVEFKILPTGYVDSKLNHRFDSAGINQTRHQIVLQIDATIMALLPGYSASSSVSTSLILAETVIVGASPEAFTQVVTEEQTDSAGIIADYGNGKG